MFCKNSDLYLGKRFELAVLLWEKKQIKLKQIGLIAQTGRTIYCIQTDGWLFNMAKKEHVYFWIICNPLNQSH